MTDLRFPVGKFQPEPELSDGSRQNLIREIAETPAKLREAVKGLSEEQLDTPYRPGGWTVRQVVHHIPDSHMNAYIRFKLGMTEQQPPVKPYKENLWAELVDAKSSPIEPSLTLLESLHQRWTVFLRSMATADFARAVNHPENGMMTLDRVLQLYAWHGRHHVAHITSLRDRMNWK
jgi:uncharacterized damage-inducible protein DinB